VLHMPIDQQHRFNRLYDLIAIRGALSSETGEVSGRLLAASFKRPIPDALRGELLMQVASQYRRTQGLVVWGLVVALNVR